MKCCVSFCKNSSKTISEPEKFTFHEFPTEQFWRNTWFVSLGMEESHLTDTAVVCSLHFRNVDFYITKCGARTLQKSAVPSAVQVCMICLDTDTKLYPMNKYNLEEAYANVTGQSISDEINFAQLLCTECAHRLTNSNRFRDKSLRARTLLLELVKKNELLTIQDIKTINRDKYELTSNIVKKAFQPDHWDLQLTEYKEEDHDIKLEKNIYNTVVKRPEVKNENKEVLSLILEPLDADMKCDNESDEEFLNDDIDNDVDFLNNDLNIEVEILKKDIKYELLNDGGPNKSGISKKSHQSERSKDTNFDNKEIIISDSDFEIVREDKVENKSLNRVGGVARRKHVNNKVKVKTDKVVSKVRKRQNKSNTKKKPALKNELKSFTSTVLTYEEQLAEVMARKQSSNYKNSHYKCPLCFKGFVNLISYNRHMAKHTNKFGEMECALCSLHFKGRHQMNHHLKSFHTMRYSCTSCVYVTKQRFTAELHERWHKGTKYKCPKCDDEFIRVSTYMSHLRVKHPSDFVCALCGYSFISEKGIQQHTRLKHRFDNVQNPEGPLCEPCNVRFASEAAYSQHVKVSPKHTTDGARVRNDPAGYSAWRKPPDDEYVTCEECGIQLKDFRLYSFHFKRVHPDKIRSKYPRTKRRCLCEQCGKVLQNPTLLRYHMSAHNGQKLFQCDVCVKSFALKTQLMLHKKIHSENRPTFGCPICEKQFTNQSNRDRHLWIHNEKYFKCEVCSKSFGTAAERRSHVAHVHWKEPWPKRKRGPRAKSGRRQEKEVDVAVDEHRPQYDTSAVQDTSDNKVW